MDYAALHNFIQSDASLAALAAAGNDNAVAAALNAPGVTPITLTTVTKNVFLKFTTPAVVRLSVGVGIDGQPLAAMVVAKWNAAMAQARAADPGSNIDLAIVALLGDPVADKVMTQDEYTGLTHRMGSRAEALLGQDVVVTAADAGASR